MSLVSQSNVTTVGIQYKPIFSTELVGEVNQTVENPTLRMELSLDRGHSFGMIIRKGLTKNLSLELGINQVTRRFSLGMDDLDSTYSENLEFKYINYELPIQGLVYTQLGERTWINSSVGLSINAFPTSVEKQGLYFSQGTKRNKKFLLAVVANVGFEYRTEKSGFFYLGTSFYNPFDQIGNTSGFYQPNQDTFERLTMDMIGNYLTLDFRYFFHEDPEKKRK